MSGSRGRSPALGIIFVVTLTLSSHLLPAQGPDTDLATEAHLGFEGPCGTSRAEAASTQVVTEATATLTTRTDPSLHGGAQAWSLSLSADGATIVEITTSGTVASTVDDPPGVRVTGFARSEITVGAGNEGAVSSVMLGFGGAPVALPGNGTFPIARLKLASLSPVLGSCATVRIFYVDGLEGSGQPIPNVVTVSGSNVDPELRDCLYTVCGAEPRWVTYDGNGDGVLDLSDVIHDLYYLFSGGNPSPCPPAMDWDHDGNRNITDPIGAFSYLFLGGPAALQGLDCEVYEGCPLAAVCSE